MFYEGQYVTLSGTGYFMVRWEVAYFNSYGEITMPTWTGLDGKLFHVASGGYRRMTDYQYDTETGEETDVQWMGEPGVDLDTLPSGALQMWQNEFYWLNGTVTLRENEASVDYNLGISLSSYNEVVSDINTTPDPTSNIIRYGKVRDTGSDSAPVPQYCTNQDETDATKVAQKSQVTAGY
ncbi:hypothetical protein KJ359_003815 [Pestalotiopsis sp. 9143b]|nr:hypothetical protein KJ359_003815 [Pestalotiopsis sp. 9143b]